MITLPPGCTVTYAVWIDINSMTPEIVEWFDLVGGRVTEEEYWNYKGSRTVRKFVQYGKGKRCHYRQDGTGGIRLHFDGADASVASMFLMKFFDDIQNHNMQRVMDQYERDNA